MPAPLDPAKRAAIADAIRAGGMSRNAIARALGVSAGMVSKVARELEEAGQVDTAFDRSNTETATRAAQVDNAARRAALEAEFLKVAEEELARRDQPVKWGNFGGRDNTYAEVELPAPTFGMRSTLVATAARAVKAAADLAGTAGNGAVAESVRLLEALAGVDPAPDPTSEAA